MGYETKKAFLKTAAWVLAGIIILSAMPGLLFYYHEAAAGETSLAQQYMMWWNALASIAVLAGAFTCWGLGIRMLMKHFDVI